MVGGILADLRFFEALDRADMFGLILMDGLSVQEEPVTEKLNAALMGVCLVGGSAGDSLDFEETRVFADGAFHSGAGTFVLVESRVPFKAFKHQHFEPSEQDLVITEADPPQRTVMEIDGSPAAAEYAELLDLDVALLSPKIFATYPVMLQIGEEWYVRSIQRVNPDGSLTFFCAIDEGLVLTIARGAEFVEALEEKVNELTEEFSEVLCTLGCDCVLRRLELENLGDVERVEAVLSRLKFTGFSTFGEQIGGIHVNQTLTGIVIGNR